MKQQTLHRLISWAVALLLPMLSMQAMSYDEARDRAWFLTDKMAHELQLTQEQYEKAYQINLDYLMSIETASDCAGRYWTYRNEDFECILLSWQYDLYVTLDYFYRPVRWWNAAWYFPIFGRYRHGFYYFPRPAVYVSYVGRGWRHRSHNTPSPYRNFHPVAHKLPATTARPSRNPGYHFTPVGKQRPQSTGNSTINRPSRTENTRPSTQSPTTTQRPTTQRPSQQNNTQQNRPAQNRPATQNHPTTQSRPTQPAQKQQQGQKNAGRTFGTSQRTGGTRQTTTRPANRGNTKASTSGRDKGSSK